MGVRLFEVAEVEKQVIIALHKQIREDIEEYRIRKENVKVNISRMQRTGSLFHRKCH